MGARFGQIISPANHIVSRANYRFHYEPPGTGAVFSWLNHLAHKAFIWRSSMNSHASAQMSAGCQLPASTVVAVTWYGNTSG